MKSHVLALACALLPVSVSNAAYIGAITTGDGTLVLGGDWLGVAAARTGSLNWNVSFDAGSGLWTYEYTFDVTGSPDISHSIVEVTDGATEADFRFTNVDGPEVGTWTPNDPENGGLPGDVFGLKIDSPQNDEPWTWSIITQREPVWQDFYAKGGRDAFAYNSGFLAADPIAPAANGSLGGHILGPNGSVPDGGMTLTLMGLALSGLALGRRFLNNS